MSCEKIRLLFSRSRSQQGLIWSKYDGFYYIFWTADPFATKLGYIVHYHKPKCLMKKLDCCVQGQCHGKISNCQWLFIKMLSFEMLNPTLPNFVRWCIIMSQIVFQKYWFAVFMFKVTVNDYVTKDDFLIYLLNCWSFCNWINLVWWHIMMSWIVLWKDWIALLRLRSRSHGRSKNSSKCSSQRYLLNRWTFWNQTWYGDAPSWTRVSCKKKDLLSSSSIKYMTVSSVSIELLIFLHPNS